MHFRTLYRRRLRGALDCNPSVGCTVYFQEQRRCSELCRKAVLPCKAGVVKPVQLFAVESEGEPRGLAIPYMGTAQAFDAQRSKRMLRKKRSETEKLRSYLGGTAHSVVLTSCGVRLRSDPKREASQRKKKNEAMNSAGSAPFCKRHHFLLFEPNTGGQHFVVILNS